MPVGREVSGNPDAPKGPPPNFLPDKDKAHALGFEKTPGINLVLPSTVMPCMHKLTYIWLNNRSALWSKPISIDQTSVTCWAWNGASWQLNKIQLRDIDSFICEWF